MKPNNEEKHDRKSGDESKDNSSSSNKNDNKERKIILRKPSDRSDSGQPRQQQSSRQ